MPDNIRAKKSLGQNFLKDPHCLSKIVSAAGIGPDDQVLEIGPGLGHLTRDLARKSKQVLAIEVDDRLITGLREEFQENQNVEIVLGDALEFPYETLAGTWKVVANLPYYISTPIIQKLLLYWQKFTSLTLTLQKEVAERIAAEPGGKEYGFLSVLVQYRTVPHIEFIVPASAFTPRPEVDSAVITLKVRSAPAIAVSDEAFFIRVVKAAFSQRRKTLRNSLRQLNVSAQKMDSVRNAIGIDLGRRAETLSVVEFGRLADFLRS